MDLLNDVKLLVLLLGFLASTCGRPTGIANQGYGYNQKQQSGGLDKILKAVLVHESTGNGLHSGSVSPADGGVGEHFKVSKSIGRSSEFTYSAKTGLKNIRVSHKSHGDTGYNQPIQRPEPHGFRDAPKGFTSANRSHDQALKSIHESLFRSRSDENVNSRQSLFAPGPFAGNGGSSGYAKSKPASFYVPAQQQEQSGYQYPKQALATIDNLRPTVQGLTSYSGSPSNGYQYPRPVQFRGEHQSNVQSSSHQIARPARILFSGSNLSNIGSSSVQSDYSTSAQGGSSHNFPASSAQSAFHSGSVTNFPVQSALSNSFQTGSPQNGYQYSDSSSNFPYQGSSAQSDQSTSFQGGSVGQSGYQYPDTAQNVPVHGSSAQSVHSTPYQGGLSAQNGYQYPDPAHNVPVHGSSAQSAHSTSYQGGSASQNGYQYIDPAQNVPVHGSSSFQGGSGSQSGYQYPDPAQNLPVYASSIQSPHSTSIQGGSTAQNGYQYANPAQNVPVHGSSVQSSHSTSYQSGSTAQNGYQYPNPAQNVPDHFPSVQSAQPATPNIFQYPDPAQKMSVHVSSAQSTHSTSFQGGSPKNGHQYPFPVQNLKNADFEMGPSVQATFSSLAQSLNGDSITVENAGSSHGYPTTKNEGYRYEKPVSMGYTYEKPAAADQIAISQFVSSLAQLNSEKEGYLYDKPVQAQNIPVHGLHKHPHPAIPSQVEEAPRQFEQPAQSSVSGYRYDSPVQNDGYHYNRPESTKSVFKGQPYLPLPPSTNKYESLQSSQFDGYRYEKPDESSRPKTTFKGQAYLPLPVSGAL